MSPHGRYVPATSIVDGGLKPGDVFRHRKGVKVAVEGLGQIQGKTYVGNPLRSGGGNATWDCRAAFHPLAKKEKGVKRPLGLNTTGGCGAFIRAGVSTAQDTEGQWNIRSVQLRHSNCTAGANMTVENVTAIGSFRAAIGGDRGVAAKALTQNLQQQRVASSSRMKVYRTVIVLELIVTFVDTIPNQSKMSGQFQNQGVQSQCTGTIISRICGSIFEGL